MIQVISINTLVVVLAVFIHYEFLVRLNELMPKLRIRHRFRIIVGIVGALIAHAFEVWVFALGFFFMNRMDGFGHIGGNFDGSLMDCVYFSFTNFTTLGFGDVVPYGDLRYLTGIESLTGLVLITWTASFLFLEMQRDWR